LKCFAPDPVGLVDYWAGLVWLISASTRFEPLSGSRKKEKFRRMQGCRLAELI
jgi:hypothetical protein